MRRLLLTGSFLFGCALVAACGSSSDNDKGSGGAAAGTGGSSAQTTGSGGSGATTGSGGGSTNSTGSGGDMTTSSTGGPAMGWTAIDLLDDPANGDTVAHKGQSDVSAIWFKDLDHGLVGLTGDNGTFGQGGAIEHASSPTTLDKVVFSGHDVPQLADQTTNIQGFYATSAGVVAAVDFQETLVISKDDGATFSIGPLGTLGGDNGPSKQIWISKDGASAWHVTDDIGNVWYSAQDPAAGTTWTRTWQPEASPTVPDPLPDGACTGAYHSGYFSFDPGRVFWVSPDGKTMMYGRGYGDDPAGLCISTDGGHSFYPKDFPNPPASSAMSVPYVITFASDAMHGLAARGSEYEDSGAYVYVTSDGGKTWAAGTLPADVMASGSKAIIDNGFFAPDGQHAWLVGYTTANDNRALILKTSDGGKTWNDVTSAFVTAVGPSAANIELHTGFALDADHIWIGGNYGSLFYSDKGGE